MEFIMKQLKVSKFLTFVNQYSLRPVSGQGVLSFFLLFLRASWFLCFQLLRKQAVQTWRRLLIRQATSGLQGLVFDQKPPIMAAEVRKRLFRDWANGSHYVDVLLCQAGRNKMSQVLKSGGNSRSWRRRP